MAYLVTGATGTIGSLIVDQLLAAGEQVRALTRNPAAAHLPAAAEVVAGDLTDPDSLTAAFDGVSAAHLITFGGDEGEALTTGPRIVDLAARAGVRRISVLGGWEETSIEPALRESALDWTVVGPAEFMSGALEWAEGIRADGRLRMLADWPSAVVHDSDIAAVAVAALTEAGHAGRTYVVTGPEVLTPAERAHLIGEAIGEDIVFEQLTVEQERERLRSYGYPEDYVAFGIELATNPPAEAAEVHDTVARVTGRPARTFAQWAEENAEAFRRG